MGPRKYMLQLKMCSRNQVTNKKFDFGSHWQNVESSDKKNKLVVEPTDKQWNPVTFCFNSLQL